MNYSPALGTCSKCGQSKIQVEGQVQCLLCDVQSTGGSGLVVKTADPGAEALDKLLVKAGVAKIEGGKPPEPVRPKLTNPINPEKINDTILHEVIKSNDLKYHVYQALSFLKSAPMPSDLKQFKAVAKAIKILENLGA